ncbi:MAG: FAD-dependent oxidoreductase [Steroidobacteraceae bacterium]
MQYSLGRREFMTQAMAGTAVLALPAGSQAAIASLADTVYDLVIVGAGTAGLPAAIFAAQRGAKVILLEAAGQIGGTLHLSTGQMSAAGTRLQRAKGIKDTPDMHYDDVMRISRGTADPVLTRLAVDAAAETFDWLMDRGFAPLDEHPILGLGHEPYSERRYYWGAEGGRTILATLRRDFDPLVTSGKVDLLLQTPVTALLTNDAGAVEGVRIQSADRERIVRGRHVLLTCGGYASNTEMFERLSGYRDYADTAYPYSMGAGLELGVSVGGFLRGRENYLCNFGSILTDSGFPGKFLGRFTVVPQRRQPWEVFVNAYGERFIREDEPSFDKREHALLKQPDIRYWIVFDEQIFATAPPGVGGWSREQMREAFGVHSWFQKADSLQALAEASGIDPQGLIRTIEAYNAGVSSGADPWGREHKPFPIVKPPF